MSLRPFHVFLSENAPFALCGEPYGAERIDNVGELFDPDLLKCEECKRQVKSLIKHMA